MLGEYLNRRVCGIVVVMVWATTGMAEAATIATYRSLSFFPPHGRVKEVPTAITPALEGTIELNYRSRKSDGCLWSLTNSSHDAEYMISLQHRKLCARLWVQGHGYVFNQSIRPGSGVNGWHSVRLSWRQGSNTLFTVDGRTVSAANSGPLRAFVVDDFYHQIGDNSSQFHIPFPFIGRMHNVVIRNTYDVSDQRMLAMWAAMLLGLLVYGWRMRGRNVAGRRPNA